MELLGFVSDFSSYVNSLDVFVLTSVYEGFGYVMIEAMTAGKPMLAFDIGTTSEIIEEGKSRYIIPQGDVTLLADKISYLSKRPNEMLEIGQRGKAVVQNKFTLQIIF